MHTHVVGQIILSCFFLLVVLGNRESAPMINAAKIRMMKVGWMIGNKREEDRKWIQVAIRGGID